MTTLRSRHVKIEGSELRFTFRGKSGVQHALSVRDRRISRIIQRCQDLPGQELFQYIDPEGRRITIASDDVNAYLREIAGSDVTAKDFRTWEGTMLTGTELRSMGPTLTKRDATSNINAALDAVAQRLGNTRAVCRKYYVHPALLDAYLEGRTAAASKKAVKRGARGKQPVAAMRLDEVAILQFLQDLL